MGNVGYSWSIFLKCVQIISLQVTICFRVTFARNTQLAQCGKSEQRTEMPQLPHPKGMVAFVWCFFTRWVLAYKSRILPKYNERTWRWQLRNKSIWSVWKVTGRVWKMLPRGSQHLPWRGQAHSSSPMTMHRQTKTKSFQESLARLVWFLNLTTETLTWERWMWKFSNQLSWTGDLWGLVSPVILHEESQLVEHLDGWFSFASDKKMFWKLKMLQRKLVNIVFLNKAWKW